MEALNLRVEFDSRKAMKKERSLSLLTSIGNTPLVQIQHMKKHLRGVQIFATAHLSSP
jgi:hypothetical protein